MSAGVIGILTGPVGIGKTTIAERVIGMARRQGILGGGLLAPAMKNSCGQKVGIWGMDAMTAERRILARTDRTLGGPTIGPYSFDTQALNWSIDVLRNAILTCDLVVVDEIGKLELWQGIGLAPILPHLARGEAHNALILVRDSLLSELQTRLQPVEQAVFTADEQNRDGLSAHLLAHFVQP